MINCKRIAKLPKGISLKDGNAVTLVQKGGKRSTRITVHAALDGDDLYLKSVETILGGDVLLGSARRHSACEICRCIDEGIGVSTDAARLMRDAVMELWMRNGLPVSVSPIMMSPVPRFVPNTNVGSKAEDPCNKIQCPRAETCRRYLPWEPCTLPYEIGKEANCEYYEPDGLPGQPRQLTIDFSF